RYREQGEGRCPVSLRAAYFGFSFIQMPIQTCAAILRVRSSALHPWLPAGFTIRKGPTTCRRIEDHAHRRVAPRPGDWRALALGTWQGIYLAEHRARPHRREIVLQFIGSRLWLGSRSSRDHAPPAAAA